jgi:hypothetical protein
MFLGCPISTSKVWKREKEIYGKELNLTPKSYGRMKITLQIFSKYKTWLSL